MQFSRVNMSGIFLHQKGMSTSTQTTCWMNHSIHTDSSSPYTCPHFGHSASLSLCEPADSLSSLGHEMDNFCICFISNSGSPFSLWFFLILCAFLCLQIPFCLFFAFLTSYSASFLLFFLSFNLLCFLLNFIFLLCFQLLQKVSICNALSSGGEPPRFLLFPWLWLW